MNSTPKLDRVFPLTGESLVRPALRAPRLGSLVRPSMGPVMGHRAFLRTWAARRVLRTPSTESSVNLNLSPLP